MVAVNHERKWRPWVLLGSAGAVAGGIFAVWTGYTDSLAAQAEYPLCELRLSHSRWIVFFYFGDLHWRLSPWVWLRGGWRFLHATLGALPLAGLLVAALVQAGNRLPKLWLLATFLTTLVFTHLVLAHWHYYLMCCPAVALLCGATVARWENFWAAQTPSWLRIVLPGIVLVVSAVDGLIAMKIATYYDPFPRRMSAIIRQYTKPEDKLIISGGFWGGEELFRSGRQGLCVGSLTGSKEGAAAKGLGDLLTSEPDLRRLKALGYSKLVLMSESPVQFAVEAVNPGSERERRYYPASISPVVDGWPVVYRSEDMLIKEIP